MPAYAIFIRDVTTDPSGMERYWAQARSLPRPEGMRALAVYGRHATIEGENPEAVSIIEFPTLEDALTWYNGPYQEAAKHRLAGSTGRAVIVEGLPPG